MTMYIHVDSNGSMKIRDHQLPDWKYGWVYAVADDFQFELGLANAEDHLYFYELLENDPRAELIFNGEVRETIMNRKYIQVDGDDGMISLADELDKNFYGWVYQAYPTEPNKDEYTMTLSPKDLDGHINIYELLDNDPEVVLVKKF